MKTHAFTFLFASAFAAAAISPAMAELAIDFPAGTLVTYASKTAGTHGFDFRVDNAVQVTGLAFWDHLADGLDESHEVGLWTQQGVLLASAIVPSGTSAGLLGEFRFVDISSLVLQPGRYRVGGYDNPGGDLLGYRHPLATDDIQHPDITFASAAEHVGDGFQFPEHAYELMGTFGGNVVLGPLNPGAVPEPSTYAAAGAAALMALAGLRQKARRSRHSDA